MICGKYITPTFFVCADCQEAYGLSDQYCEWPRWAKRMAQDHSNERRADRRRLAAETDWRYARVVHEIRSYGEFNEDGAD